MERKKFLENFSLYVDFKVLRRGLKSVVFVFCPCVDDNYAYTDTSHKDSDSEEEPGNKVRHRLKKLMGKNPVKEIPQDLVIEEEIADRVNSWLQKGVGLDTKKDLLSKIPQKGNIFLKAPILNEEMEIKMKPRQRKRDDHFKEYQDSAGAALSCFVQAFNMIIRDTEEPVSKDILKEKMSSGVQLLADLFFNLTGARRSFIIPMFEDNIKFILEKTVAKELLFGENFKDAIANAKTLDKTTKEIKKPYPPERQQSRVPFQQRSVNFRGSSKKEGNSVNWRSDRKPFRGRKDQRQWNSYNQTQPMSYPRQKRQ